MKPTDIDAGEWRTVHRVVFPVDADPTTLPLYVDERASVTTPGSDPAGTRDPHEGIMRADRDRVTTATPVLLAATQTLSDVERSSATVAARVRVSFASYFNAFPAAYWREWTTADRVRLRVELQGIATINVYRSTVRGSMVLLETRMRASGRLDVEVPLNRFGDGGWLWFDLETGEQEARLVSAVWEVEEAHARRVGRATVAVTTYNRPDDCVELTRRIAAAPDLRTRVDRLLIVDQGSQHVADADGFAEIAHELGDTLRIERQPNLGGSGGFARGMLEASTTESSDYVLLLDDDVVLEPEGLLRLIEFSDFTRKPTIVGGHMLNLHERSVLHSYGEAVNLYRAMWHSVNPTLESFNFAANTLRSTAALHARVDVDYNGWWMCLIPTEVVREIGLALPAFIKWDDAEYGLRAGRAGVPTVSLPGAAVWHMPWTEKDDRLDWQAYYHQRNRWLVGLLYSPYPRGGSLGRESFTTDVKHLLSLQYSPVAMRNHALRDLLRGPAHLHRTLPTRAGEMRALHADYTDGQVIRDVGEYPDVRRRRVLRKGKRPSAPRGLVGWILRAGSAGVRHLFVKSDGDGAPEERVAAPDARWWRLAGVDSALVSTADATGVSIYRRSPRQYRALLGESVRLHILLAREWRRLAREYRAALPDITSAEAWRRSFQTK